MRFLAPIYNEPKAALITIDQIVKCSCAMHEMEDLLTAPTLKNASVQMDNIYLVKGVIYAWKAA